MFFITISTSDYFLNTKRLVLSLRKHHPNCAIMVFGDNPDLEKEFSRVGANFCFLREIASLGVKRAKFMAYKLAAQKGGFVYLDADILVLKPLESLLNVAVFTACRDDLSECHFISDPRYPWAENPDLSGENYFNSGVFSVPTDFLAFFNDVADEALDDDEWARFTIPGMLYDNHFLCAKIAQRGVNVNFLSEHEYNWQGFKRFGKLNCHVDSEGDLKSNQASGKLRLAHFAGIRDIDSYIASLPVDVARVLVTSISENAIGYLELLGAAVMCPQGIDNRLKSIMARSMIHDQSLSDNFPGAELPLLKEDSAAVASIVQSVCNANFYWNGLACGSSYLSASEYKRIRDFLVSEKVASVLEFGAGYTTALFHRYVSSQVALEAFEGPWLAFAREQGAAVRLVRFCREKGFDERELSDCVTQVFGSAGKRLVFIDSPQGTANRSVVVGQVIQHAHDADYFVVHDSIRDSSVVYRLMTELGLRVLEHFDSHRGLTFLAKANISAAAPSDISILSHSLMERVALCAFDVRFEVVPPVASEDIFRMAIRLSNTGSCVIPFHSESLGFSMHVRDREGAVVVWDMPRYQLPVDLDPGDEVTFSIMMPDSVVQGTCFAFDFVKEGDFWWSQVSGMSCPQQCFYL